MRGPELTVGELPLALIGMPGSGKSAVGKELARRLDFPFADCDKAIESRAASTIPRIFESVGEEGFRRLEAEVLAALVEDGPSVIATGGGVVLRAENRDLLRTRTQCVYLSSDIALLWRRLRRDRRRPLLQVPDPQERLRQMDAEREPLYRETASIVIDTRGLSFDRLVTAVLARVTATT